MVGRKNKQTNKNTPYENICRLLAELYRTWNSNIGYVFLKKLYRLILFLFQQFSKFKYILNLFRKTSDKPEV